MAIPHRPDLANWFWTIGGDNSRYWSAAADDWVTELPEGADMTPADTWENLMKVLWPPLTQRKFWKALAITGMYTGIMAHIDTLPLEDQIEAKQAQEYLFDHWLITETRPLFGLDDAQFKTLWFWAYTL